MKWARGQMADEDLDVQLLMYDFCRRIDATQQPGGQTVIQFVFADLPKFAHCWSVIEGNHERELCVNNPGKPVDIQARSDVRTMAEIWAGDTDIRTAQKAGGCTSAGIPRWCGAWRFGCGRACWPLSAPMPRHGDPRRRGRQPPDDQGRVPPAAGRRQGVNLLRWKAKDWFDAVFRRHPSSPQRQRHRNSSRRSGGRTKAKGRQSFSSLAARHGFEP